MLRYQVARKGRPTAAILRRLVGDQDVDAVVCWGMPYDGGLPSLNGAAGRIDKYQQGLELNKRIPSVKVLTPKTALTQFKSPMLGRALSHAGGKDILICLSPEDVALRTAAGAEYFTPWVDIIDEYRVWVYRGRHMGTYEKVMRHPEKYKKIGRNHGNGFAFELIPTDRVNRDAIDLASKAVSALGLDFGAVDVARTRTGELTVLEVNTAPGVETADRQVIRALAEHIKRWVRNGTPERRRNG